MLKYGKHLTLLVLSLLIGCLCSRSVVTSAPQEKPYDLLITNARVVDGSGNPWYRADIGIKGGHIAAIGRLSPSQSVKTIDAANQIVAPGFIDVHTHVESIYSLPAAENFVRMGVTTLVTGNCGGSTTDVAQFLGRIKEQPLAVNLATLIAHGSVRRQVMGTDDRAPTPEEMKQMELMVEQASLPVEISHFKISSKKLWGQTPMTIGLVRTARERGLVVTVDQYAYTASSTSLDSRLPGWLRAGGIDEARKRLADPATRERVVKEMKEGLKRSGFKD